MSAATSTRPPGAAPPTSGSTTPTATSCARRTGRRLLLARVAQALPLRAVGHRSSSGPRPTTTSGSDAARRAPRSQTGLKTTCCILDEEFCATLPGTRADPTYNLNGCHRRTPRRPDRGPVGRLVGHLRLVPAGPVDRPGSQTTLADGDYVLRSVSDPDNQIQESAERHRRAATLTARAAARTPRSAASRSRAARSSGLDQPTGTVTLNKVDRTTEPPAVTLEAIGRDDVSGPNRIRISNNGVTWSERASPTGDRRRTRSPGTCPTRPPAATRRSASRPSTCSSATSPASGATRSPTRSS